MPDAVAAPSRRPAKSASHRARDEPGGPCNNGYHNREEKKAKSEVSPLHFEFTAHQASSKRHLSRSSRGGQPYSPQLGRNICARFQFFSLPFPFRGYRLVATQGSLLQLVARLWWKVQIWRRKQEGVKDSPSNSIGDHSGWNGRKTVEVHPGPHPRCNPRRIERDHGEQNRSASEQDFNRSIHREAATCSAVTGLISLFHKSGVTRSIPLSPPTVSPTAHATASTAPTAIELRENDPLFLSRGYCITPRPK